MKNYWINYNYVVALLLKIKYTNEGKLYTKISEINNMENKVINKCLENNILVTFCGKLDDNYFIYYQDLVLVKDESYDNLIRCSNMYSFLPVDLLMVLLNCKQELLNIKKLTKKKS